MARTATAKLNDGERVVKDGRITPAYSSYCRRIRVPGARRARPDSRRRHRAGRLRARSPTSPASRRSSDGIAVGEGRDHRAPAPADALRVGAAELGEKIRRALSCGAWRDRDPAPAAVLIGAAASRRRAGAQLLSSNGIPHSSSIASDTDARAFSSANRPSPDRCRSRCAGRRGAAQSDGEQLARWGPIGMIGSERRTRCTT